MMDVGMRHKVMQVGPRRQEYLMCWQFSNRVIHGSLPSPRLRTMAQARRPSHQVPLRVAADAIERQPTERQP